jgi:hypothetical protein
MIVEVEMKVRAPIPRVTRASGIVGPDRTRLGAVT